MLSVPDFLQGRKLDLKHPLDLRERGLSPSAISENVEFVGAIGGEANDVFVQGDYAYLCAGGVLAILDISEPAHPTKVGYIALPGLAMGAYISESYAYVVARDGGLRVIDVSNPQNPVEVGFYDTLGDANDVYVSESYAYVADGDSGLRVIDVSSPENPVEVGFYDTPGSAFCVYVSGSYAYVADYDRGLRVIDVSAPQNPFEVGFYDTSGEANGVYVSGGLIYVADGFGGLYILRYTGGEPFYGDGNITAYDAALILQVVVGILNLGDTEYLTLERADVTGNGTVSALDAALVLQYTVGLITEFPCQQPAGAPTLNLEAEPKLLAEAIEQIESVTLSKEGQQVLEILKRLVPKPISQNRTADAVGLSTALFQNFPNPFNPDTWLPYQIARDAPVTISIYDAKGQLIRTLDLGNQKAGVYVTENRAAYWDGRDNAGEKVASGVYFYTLRVGDFTTTRKMAILK